jgi:low affinity Fe/Cu permease
MSRRASWLSENSGYIIFTIAVIVGLISFPFIGWALNWWLATVSNFLGPIT